ncbi:hypothetical protein CGQ24_18350 [Arthrobacter sp. 7749]|nr:hypothetical protein CGQ24_18350 [Arthrobacter sp. 7749]
MEEGELTNDLCAQLFLWLNGALVAGECRGCCVGGRALGCGSFVGGSGCFRGVVLPGGPQCCSVLGIADGLRSVGAQRIHGGGLVENVVFFAVFQHGGHAGAHATIAVHVRSQGANVLLACEQVLGGFAGFCLRVGCNLGTFLNQFICGQQIILSV